MTAEVDIPYRAFELTDFSGASFPKPTGNSSKPTAAR